MRNNRIENCGNFQKIGPMTMPRRCRRVRKGKRRSSREPVRFSILQPGDAREKGRTGPSFFLGYFCEECKTTVPFFVLSSFIPLELEFHPRLDRSILRHFFLSNFYHPSFSSFLLFFFFSVHTYMRTHFFFGRRDDSRGIRLGFFLERFFFFF